jgi:ribosomal protein S8
LQLGLIVFFKNTTIDNKKKYKVKFSKWGGKTIVKKLIVIKKSKSNTVGTYTILQKLNKENIFIVSNNSGIENLNFNLWKNNGGILLCKIII